MVYIYIDNYTYIHIYIYIYIYLGRPKDGCRPVATPVSNVDWRVARKFEFLSDDIN